MNYCALLASGKGTRMGFTEIPKQFMKISGVPLIVYTIRQILKSNQFQCIAIGVLEEYVAITKQIIDKYFSDVDNFHIVIGDSLRMNTFANIIDYLDQNHKISNSDCIMLMDANRPFVTATLINSCIEAVSDYPIATLGSKVIDGIALSKNGEYISAIPRKGELFSIQTPEVCNLHNFIEIYKNIQPNEKEKLLGLSEVFIYNGIEPRIIKSTHFCFKITTNIDLSFAKFLIENNLIGEEE